MTAFPLSWCKLDNYQTLFYNIYQVTSLRSSVLCSSSVKWISVALSNYYLIYLMMSLSNELITSFKGVKTFSKSIQDNYNNSKLCFCCSVASDLANVSLVWFSFLFFLPLFAPYPSVNCVKNSAHAIFSKEFYVETVYHWLTVI